MELVLAFVSFAALVGAWFVLPSAPRVSAPSGSGMRAPVAA